MTNQLNVEAALAAVLPSLREQHRAAPRGADLVAVIHGGDPEGPPVCRLLPRTEAGWHVRAHKFGMTQSCLILSGDRVRGCVPSRGVR